MSFGDYFTDAFATAKAIVGQQVTYQRGDDWTKVCGIAGTSTFDVVEADGTLVQYQSKDWLFAACDLNFGDDLITPRKGDLVKEEVGGQVYVYEVIRPDGGQVYRYSDTGRTQVRVHTKLKETIAQ